MEEADEQIRSAVQRTEILRAPKRSLATFGTTNIYYYLVTEPVYKEETAVNAETVVREGRVIAERPRIVTPYYLSQLEGFSQQARRYFQMLISTYGASAPGLLYKYRNEPKELSIVQERMAAVVDRLNTEIDRRGDPLVSIIKAEDELWDVSIMKFIYEMTRHSLRDNVQQLNSRGLLDIGEDGIPADARAVIEELFARVKNGEMEPYELKAELDRWRLFDEYQDRFFALFKRKR